MSTANLRRKLNRPGDGPLLGSWIMYVRTPGIVRMAAMAGLDYVIVDNQHSAIDWETMADMCELARACGIAAFVRPSMLNEGTVNRIQDLGAHGVMVPGVEDRATVDDCRGWMRYPPHGTRGVTVGGPATDYSVAPLDAATMADSNDRQVLLIQIESRAGLDALEDILDGGGVDGIEVGRNDLAADLGVPGQVRHPLVMAALDRLIDVCSARDVGVGLMASSDEEAKEMATRGVALLNWRSDKAILGASYRQFVAGLRDAGSTT